jgi:ribosomal protein L13
MQDRSDSRGGSGWAPLRARRPRQAVARKVRLMLPSSSEGAVTFFAPQRLSRYAGQVGVARSLGQAVASRTASHRAVARKVRLMLPSSTEGAVTLFALQRLSRYAGQVGFARRLGQGASRAASASSSRAQREGSCRRSRMEGAVTFFALQRLSRYAGQIGLTRRLRQGPTSRAMSASSGRA